MISISIMGIPERQSHIRYLQKYFQSNGISPYISIDWNHQGIWQNSKKAWQSVSSEFHLVIQDDAYISTEFIPYVKSLITSVDLSDHIVSFYQSEAYKEFLNNKEGLVQVNRIGGAVATMMNRANVLRSLLWISRNIPDTYMPGIDDERFATWQVANAILTYVPCPQIVWCENIQSTRLKKRYPPKRLTYAKDFSPPIEILPEVHFYDIHPKFQKFIRGNHADYNRNNS